jgi:hypothetical protein
MRLYPRPTSRPTPPAAPAVRTWRQGSESALQFILPFGEADEIPRRRPLVSSVAPQAVCGALLLCLETLLHHAGIDTSEKRPLRL